MSKWRIFILGMLFGFFSGPIFNFIEEYFNMTKTWGIIMRIGFLVVIFLIDFIISKIKQRNREKKLEI